MNGSGLTIERKWELYWQAFEKPYKGPNSAVWLSLGRDREVVNEYKRLLTNCLEENIKAI